MTPLRAFLADASFAVALGCSVLPALGGTEGLGASGGGLLMAFSLAATALRGRSTRRRHHELDQVLSKVREFFAVLKPAQPFFLCLLLSY